MKRTPIRRRSKKTAKTYREQRIPLVIQMLSENPWCVRCQRSRATDVHEVKSRARGGSILDPENLVTLCRPCHTYITQNPAQGHAEGLLKHSWEA